MALAPHDGIGKQAFYTANTGLHQFVTAESPRPVNNSMIIIGSIPRIMHVAITAIARTRQAAVIVRISRQLIFTPIAL